MIDEISFLKNIMCLHFVSDIIMRTLVIDPGLIAHNMIYYN